MTYETYRRNNNWIPKTDVCIRWFFSRRSFDSQIRHRGFLKQFRFFLFFLFVRWEKNLRPKHLEYTCAFLGLIEKWEMLIDFSECRFFFILHVPVLLNLVQFKIRTSLNKFFVRNSISLSDFVLFSVHSLEILTNG